MKKRHSLFFLFFFFYLLLVPSAALTSAREGLLLWYRSILPSLFPFMLLCSLALRLGLLDSILPGLYRPFHALTGCSPYGAFAILTGFLCGFPMGAKITYDLKHQKKISPAEAAWLMGFVNNLSPAFLISYLAHDQMKLSSWTPVFLLNILGSSLIYGLITSISYRQKEMEAFCGSSKHPKEFRANHPSASSSGVSDMEIFPIIDDCINDTVKSVVRLGAYIMIFAIIGGALEILLPAGHPITFFLLPAIEVTNGIHLLAASELPFFARFILINALCSFGGFCALAQSAGIASMDKTALLDYIKSRVCITLLSACLSCGSILFSVIL